MVSNASRLVIKSLNFPIKDHIDLGKNLNVVDLERAAKTAGARFYHLQGGLV